AIPPSFSSPRTRQRTLQFRSYVPRAKLKPYTQTQISSPAVTATEAPCWVNPPTCVPLPSSLSVLLPFSRNTRTCSSPPPVLMFVRLTLNVPPTLVVQ